jgi:hypothetical protein
MQTPAQPDTLSARAGPAPEPRFLALARALVEPFPDTDGESDVAPGYPSRVHALNFSMKWRASSFGT